MPLSPLFDVTLTLYFRVRDSEMYGGAGSVGYASQALNHCMAPEHADEAAAEHVRSYMATMLGVVPECLEFISADEYEAETEEPGEDDDE